MGVSKNKQFLLRPILLQLFQNGNFLLAVLGRSCPPPFAVYNIFTAGDNAMLCESNIVWIGIWVVMFDSHRLDNCWLAIQVRSGWELRTAEALRASGYEEFVPLHEQKRERSGRTGIVRVPLFTGYVFFRFEARNERPVVLIPGVIRFVGTRNSPVPIQISEIESLQIASRARANWGPHPYLEFGATVEIYSGPLCGLKGNIVRFKNKSRLVISVNLIRESVFVEVEEHDVRPIVPLSMDTRNLCYNHNISTHDRARHHPPRPQEA
jgi:transcription antitermination factor NusG